VKLLALAGALLGGWEMEGGFFGQLLRLRWEIGTVGGRCLKTGQRWLQGRSSGDGREQKRKCMKNRLTND
jgi:hypothetical protein